MEIVNQVTNAPLPVLLPILGEALAIFGPIAFGVLLLGLLTLRGE